MPLFSFFLGGGDAFTIDFEPEPGVIAADFDRMAAALDEMHPALVASRDAFIAGVHRHFDEGGPGWAPPARDYGWPLLQRTGEMRAGVTSEGSYNVTARQVIFTGAAAPDRWLIHQFGAGHQVGKALEVRPPRGGIPFAGATPSMRLGFAMIPARPFIYTDGETEAAIDAIWLAWVDSIIGGFGVGVGGSFRVTSGGRVQTKLGSGKFGPFVH
jgi:phage gpG-like protein